MNLLPAVKCICPSCFEEIYLGDCRIVSRQTTGKVLKPRTKGWYARMNVESLDGRKYTLESACRECTECQYLLPSNIELVPSITLVVVGDISSGKSHYIAALIHQIKTQWIGGATGFARFTCLTPDIEEKYTQEYFEPLFTNRRVINPTLAARDPKAKPLIYKLVMSPSPRHPTTTFNLMLYDTSGEDYVGQGRLVRYAQFVLNTSAFIFVADPFTMDSIFNQLDPTLRTMLQSQFGLLPRTKAVAGLNSVIEVFENYHKVSDGSSLPHTPVAVMLSKADLLKYFTRPNNFHFMTNPQYRGGVNLQDINIVDQEVRQLLEQYNEGALLRATSRFRKLKFFATSATGEPPDVTGHFTKVEPLRCLDPVLWILHQLDIVKASI